MNENPAFESLRVLTHPLTVVTEPLAIAPESACFILVNDMFFKDLLSLNLNREPPDNKAPSTARTPLPMDYRKLACERLEYVD
jgi:hypothetical protein